MLSNVSVSYSQSTCWVWALGPSGAPDDEAAWSHSKTVTTAVTQTDRARLCGKHVHERTVSMKLLKDCYWKQTQ